MPKHLYTLPAGTALPDPTGQPEGLPFVLDDGAGNLTLHSIRGGVYEALTSGASGGGAAAAGVLNGFVMQALSGQVPLTPANNSFINGLLPTNFTGLSGEAPPVEAFYNTRGRIGFGAADGVFAVHFDITMTGFTGTDATAYAQVTLPTGIGGVSKVSAKTKPDSGGNLRIDLDYVVKGVGFILQPQLNTVFASGAPSVDSWNLEVVPIVATPTTPATVHSIDTNPSGVVPAVTSPAAGTVHVTWGNLAGASASDSIEVRVEVAATNGTISNFTTVVAGNQTAADVTGVTSGRMAAVSLLRTRADGTPATRDFAGHVTVA